MNKSEFIAAMEAQLLRLPKADRDDILNDFEAHFVNGLAEGKTEEDVSAELGEPAELAAVYLENLPAGSKGAPYIPQPSAEDEQGNTQEQGNQYQNPQYQNNQPWQPVPQPVYPQESKPVSAGGIVATVLISIFVACPILWTIFGIVMWLFGCSIGCAVGAVCLLVFGVATFSLGALTASGFILVALALVALCVLLITLGIMAVKGTIQLVKWYVGCCKKMIGGSNK